MTDHSGPESGHIAYCWPKHDRYYQAKQEVAVDLAT